MITLISSTNRKSSLTLTITKYYQEILRRKGAESVVVDLSELPIDFLFTALYGQTGKNEHFNEFGQIIENSKKFVQPRDGQFVRADRTGGDHVVCHGAIYSKGVF